MHEFSIAASLVESLMAFAEKQRAAQVIEVRLTIGEFTHIEHEQLRFCFQSITTGTLLENSALEIDTSDAAVRCPHCGYAGPPKYWDGALEGALVPTLQCPECGKSAEPAEGHECTIKTVKFTREDEPEYEPSIAT
jgi:hydrogenase nickel incorporation protein HypA/HybF